MMLCGAALLTAFGCTKYVPAKRPPAPPAPAKVPSLNVRSLGTPSALIAPPPAPAGDSLPFDLPLNKGYSIDGSWRGPSQIQGTTAFERIGDFTVKRADDADVNPKEIWETLEKWIVASGVVQTQGSGQGLERTTEYGTAQTLGSISVSIRPETPAKTVTFHLGVREQPRASR